MNRSALKKYAPQARPDFTEAVTLRALRIGIDPTLPVSVEQSGNVLLFGRQPFPASVAKQRAELSRRIQQQGFDAVVEALRAGESANEAIRRYLSTSFYKDHLQTYKKRPVYWLSPAASQRPLSAWSSCTATTKAHSRVCAWNMSCRCKAAYRPVSTISPTISTAPPAAPNKKPCKSAKTSLPNNSKNSSASTKTCAPRRPTHHPRFG